MPPLNQSSTVYYPSLVFNLELRFDEGLTVLSDPVSADALAQSGGKSGALNFVQASDLASSQIELPLLAQKGSDNLTFFANIVPKSASVELPGYRQAGKFSLDMPFQQLPIDPRVLRACAVSIHLGTVSSVDFAHGMTGGLDPTSQVGSRRSSVLVPTPDNLILYGVVDTIGNEFDDGVAMLHLEGRDLIGLFLDTKVTGDTLKKIDFTKPIDQIVSLLVNQLAPRGGSIVVKVADASQWLDADGNQMAAVPSPGASFTNPSTGGTSKASKSSLTRSNSDAAGDAPAPPGKADVTQMSIWDAVTQYCYLVGAIPKFVGRELHIAPAQSIFDTKRKEVSADTFQMGSETFDLSTTTPFLNGAIRTVSPPTVTNPEQFYYRRVVYGRDILSLKFERKIGGVKVPVIRCISIDPGVKNKGIDPETQLPYNTIVAEYPATDATGEQNKKARTTAVAPGGQATETEIIPIKVPGVKTQKQLALIAQALHEEIGRQEIGGSISTKNMASFGGDRRDPDLVKLRPGDPIEVRIDATGLTTFPPPINELVNHERRSREQEIQAVKKALGGDSKRDQDKVDNLARILVATSRGEIVQLDKTFRVGNVKFTWDVDSGIAIDADFQNYVEIRNVVKASA